jgi:acetylcholinesterase
MNHPSLPSANAGLLDQRMAMRWVKQYITEFGGSSEDVTIMGQSGGGWAIACQMALYDGNTQGLFTKAIPRSVQREPAYTTSELQVRNNVLAGVLNCTSAQDQLDCLRNASVPDLVGSFITMSSILGTEG